MNRDNSCCVDFDLGVDDNGVPYVDRQEDSWLPLLPSVGFLLEF